MNNKPKQSVSKAQLEVWEWKEKAAASVLHLPVGERIRFIMERAQKTSEQVLRHKGTDKNKKAAVPAIQ
ncbi:MAG: hypothetical protein JNJ90_04665 [Saprospiraceae bacterium]|jgi:hypothetical protein|nr:hypothetical protein [Saprospiraceae bacterium]